MRLATSILLACTVAVLGTAPAGAATRSPFVRIPGFPKERIDPRLLGDVAYLVRTYHLRVNAGFAMTGHAGGGEHPIGVALDVGPSRGPRGSWDEVDRLARWAEPRQGHPRAPFIWVGYNGDPGHGRGAHLHLSWRHTPAAPGHMARKIWTLTPPTLWMLDPTTPFVAHYG